MQSDLHLQCGARNASRRRKAMHIMNCPVARLRLCPKVFSTLRIYAFFDRHLPFALTVLVLHLVQVAADMVSV